MHSKRCIAWLIRQGIEFYLQLKKKDCSFIINSPSENLPNGFRKHQVHKRQVPAGGVGAAMAVLYDLETALRNTSTVIDEFQEASTVKNLNITLDDKPPDFASINDTLEQLEKGKFIQLLKAYNEFSVKINEFKFKCTV